MSLISKVAMFARSPQGKRVINQAVSYAKSPQGREQLARAAQRVQAARKAKRPPR
jgi:hypothetical protein